MDAQEVKGLFTEIGIRKTQAESIRQTKNKSEEKWTKEFHDFLRERIRRKKEDVWSNLKSTTDVSIITDAVCDGAPAYNMQYNKGKNEIILKFRRDQVTEQPLDTNFTVTGHFGIGMVFEGSDEILKVVE